MPAAQAARDQPRGAARARRASVRGPAALVAQPGSKTGVGRTARSVRSNPALRRAREGSQARVQTHRRQRRRRRRDLPATGRPAPRDRARDGPDQRLLTGSLTRPAEQPAGTTTRRCARPSSATADASCHDRVELSATGTWRAAVVRAAFRLLRYLVRCGRSRGRQNRGPSRDGNRHPRRPGFTGRQEPDPTGRSGSRRAPARDAGDNQGIREGAAG